MKNKDVALVRRTLDGDDTAFTELVQKYQKPIHALAWRKIGDFHIAEEIVQDTFLKAYQKLATLKKPQRFASWLYVITTNLCSTWLRRKRLWTQPLEEGNFVQEKGTYSGYVIEENERTRVEAQREVVKKLLAKLQESERTVITLHYFGEMSSAEIGEFLGVSANTVRSRLHRAQQRLKKEEPMIREALNSFQLSANLTENIMREIARIKPVAPSGGKPLVPWAIAASTVAVVLFMIGVGNQHLTRFQQPYNFDATSEMKVELIEAPIVLPLESKPDVRTQLGNPMTSVKNNGNGQQLNQPEYLARFAAAPVDETEAITDANKGKRYITLSAITKEESGTTLAAGNFYIEKIDTVLKSRGFGTHGIGKGDPNPRYMLMYYILHHNTDLFRFPLVIGDSWMEEGYWNSWVQTTIEDYERVEIAAGVFPDCLKHKTVFTGTNKAGSPLKNSLVNGTRYLWFAKGVGVVKMRYEHANGTITESELLEYNIPANTAEYFPVEVNNTWTYKWRNDYREEASIETCQVTKNADKRPDQDTHLPAVKRTIPDLSEKVPTDLKEIRIIFNERMIGMDVGFAEVPVGDIQWTNDNTTLVISFERPLASSKIYRLILGGEGNIRDVTGKPLEEHTFTFTTEGPEPVTPTFVDTTPIDAKGIEELDLSSGLLGRVSTDFTDGFAFPYYLFIPQGIDFSKPVYLLIEPCNTGKTTDNFKIHDRKAKALIETSHATEIARKLKVPLLVPVFPRPGRDRWQIYTHSLDRDTLLIKEGELRRIDLQLIKMIAHAQKLLRHNNVKVNEKVFMHGFSASGTFANRFAILHPKVVRAVATGGVNGIPTFPTDRWNNTTIRYPVGIADVKAIADIEFDETAYKQVSQYIYMGALDDNDTVPYRDAFDEVDAKLVRRLIGTKMMPDRWAVSQSIYEALGIPAQFVTYARAGHEINVEMIDDIVAFFKANWGNEIVEIAPHQHLSEE